MKESNNFGIFLAARSGSKRLPNKHFIRINSNIRFIDLCILRLKKTKITKKIFLCTTKKKEDNKFLGVSKLHNINLFRGSNNNVAKRIIDCAKKYSIKTIIRITADCPLIDPKLIDKCANIHLKNKNDYTSNILTPSFPDGLDVEFIELKTLIKSQYLSKTNQNKEHVTQFIRVTENFKKENFKNSKDYSDRRWTLDDQNDLVFLKKVVNYFSPNIYFSWKDLIKMEKKKKALINLRDRQVLHE